MLVRAGAAYGGVGRTWEEEAEDSSSLLQKNRGAGKCVRRSLIVRECAEAERESRGGGRGESRRTPASWRD